MTVIGSAEMGRHTSCGWQPECVYVPGAEIPAGDCVIMLEDASAGGQLVAVYKNFPTRRNLIFRGDDVRPQGCRREAARALVGPHRRWLWV